MTVNTTLFICDLYVESELDTGLLHIFNMETMVLLHFLWKSKCCKGRTDRYEA